MRFGYCCKYITSIQQIDGIKPKHDSYVYNIGTTTLASLSKLSQAKGEEKLWRLIRDNLSAIKRLVNLVSMDIPEKRMLRLSSDILPMYTHPDWKYYYGLDYVRRYLEKEFGVIGRIARDNDIRLSFHPGQFTVLSSHREDVVKKSIEEFEYHCDMVRWMNYGQKFQDMKVNVHLSGKGGAEMFRKVYQQLSHEARNTITIENDEFTSSLKDCLEIGDIVPIVFDIHHEWIHKHRYLDLNSDDIKRVQDSWRGVRPVMHYSQSTNDVLSTISSDDLPDIDILLESGYKKQKLRAHSDFYTNRRLNQLIKDFATEFDIQCESKSKNLGRDLLLSELYGL